MRPSRVPVTPRAAVGQVGLELGFVVVEGRWVEAALLLKQMDPGLWTQSSEGCRVAPLRDPAISHV